jgi:hypothetical protein
MTDNLKITGAKTDEQVKAATRAVVATKALGTFASVCWAAATAFVLSVAIQNCTTCGFAGPQDRSAHQEK